MSKAIYEKEMHFKISKSLLTNIKEKAEKEEVTVSELMRNIIKDYFKKR